MTPTTTFSIVSVNYNVVLTEGTQSITFQVTDKDEALAKAQLIATLTAAVNAAA